MLDLHAASDLAGIMGAMEGAALDHQDIACLLPEGPVTFAALRGRTEAALAALRRRGIAPDAVLALPPATVAGLLPALAACSAAGAVLLPLPAGMAPGEARALATRCGAVPMPEGGDGAPADAALDGPQARDPHRVCLVLHGAGTGGELRPASLGAAALLSAARGLLGAHPLARKDVVLSDACQWRWGFLRSGV